MGAKGDAMGSTKGWGGGVPVLPPPCCPPGPDEQQGGPIGQGEGYLGPPLRSWVDGGGARPTSPGPLPTFQASCPAAEAVPPPAPDPPLLFLPHPETLGLCQEPWHRLQKWPHGWGGAWLEETPPRWGAWKRGSWEKGEAGKRGGLGKVRVRAGLGLGRGQIPGWMLPIVVCMGGQGWGQGQGQGQGQGRGQG